MKQEKNIMSDDVYDYDPETGLPLNKEYLECDLPEFLQDSLNEMKKSLAITDAGGEDSHWDGTWCLLNSDINIAEVEHMISSEQAWHLREKYLGMERV